MLQVTELGKSYGGRRVVGITHTVASGAPRSGALRCDTRTVRLLFTEGVSAKMQRYADTRRRVRWVS